MKKKGIGWNVYLTLAALYLLQAIFCYVGDKSSMGPMWACFAFSMFCIGVSTNDKKKEDNVEKTEDKEKSEDE